MIMILLKGASMTLLLWLSSCMLSLSLGLCLGILRCSLLRIFLVSSVADTLCVLLRGVPLYAQLTITYFLLPALFNIQLSASVTGILTLGICSAAYTSELVRSAFNSLDKGQWQAAQVLGYTVYQQVRFILFPQMFKRALPGLMNEAIQVLKSTALLGSIGTLSLRK